MNPVLQLFVLLVFGIFTSFSPSSTPVIAKEERDTIALIHFEELSLSITPLITYEPESENVQIHVDTATIFAEVGESMEAQRISVSSDLLTDLKLEQRYETSVTIMAEGPHCDLTGWKHHYTDWKELAPDAKGQFTVEKCPEKEAGKFPKVSMADLRLEAAKHCGEEWTRIIEQVSSPTEYPCGVSVSRYYLRISGKRKDTGQTLTKWVMIEIPMGC